MFVENRAVEEGRDCYLMYNVSSDVVEEASEGFFREFEIDSNLFRSNGETITGKEVFENFDFCVNQKPLESNEGITTSMTMKKLCSSDYKH